MKELKRKTAETPERISSNLESVQIDVKNGIFKVNGVTLPKVDFFNLYFYDGKLSLSVRSEYFANGIKLVTE